MTENISSHKDSTFVYDNSNVSVIAANNLEGNVFNSQLNNEVSDQPELLNSVGDKKSFHITSVTVQRNSTDANTNESADEWRTEELSDNIDMSAVSVQTETTEYPENIIRKDDVLYKVTSVGSAPIIPTSAQYGIAVVSNPNAELADNVNKFVSDNKLLDSVHKNECLQNGIEGNCGTNVATKEFNAKNERFKVVKIESNEPFRRGRWVCMDFLDQSMDQVKKAATASDKAKETDKDSTEVLVNGAMNSEMTCKDMTTKAEAEKIQSQPADASIVNGEISNSVSPHQTLTTPFVPPPSLSQSQAPAQSLTHIVIPATSQPVAAGAPASGSYGHSQNLTHAEVQHMQQSSHPPQSFTPHAAVHSQGLLTQGMQHMSSQSEPQFQTVLPQQPVLQQPYPHVQGSQARLQNAQAVTSQAQTQTPPQLPNQHCISQSGGGAVNTNEPLLQQSSNQQFQQQNQNLQHLQMAPQVFQSQPTTAQIHASVQLPSQHHSPQQSNQSTVSQIPSQPTSQPTIQQQPVHQPVVPHMPNQPSSVQSSMQQFLSQQSTPLPQPVIPPSSAPGLSQPVQQQLKQQSESQLLMQPPQQLMQQPESQHLMQPPQQLMQQPESQHLMQPESQHLMQPPQQLMQQPESQHLMQSQQMISQPLQSQVPQTQPQMTMQHIPQNIPQSLPPQQMQQQQQPNQHHQIMQSQPQQQPQQQLQHSMATQGNMQSFQNPAVQQQQMQHVQPTQMMQQHSITQQQQPPQQQMQHSIQGPQLPQQTMNGSQGLQSQYQTIAAQLNEQNIPVSAPQASYQQQQQQQQQHDVVLSNLPQTDVLIPNQFSMTAQSQHPLHVSYPNGAASQYVNASNMNLVSTSGSNPAQPQQYYSHPLAQSVQQSHQPLPPCSQASCTVTGSQDVPQHLCSHQHQLLSNMGQQQQPPLISSVVSQNLQQSGGSPVMQNGAVPSLGHQQPQQQQQQQQQHPYSGHSQPIYVQNGLATVQTQTTPISQTGSTAAVQQQHFAGTQPPAGTTTYPATNMGSVHAMQLQPRNYMVGMAPTHIYQGVQAFSPNAQFHERVAKCVKSEEIPFQKPSEDADSSGNGYSAVAIDNKIEQAMDLVKSHLMFAVREEVEVLKEKIAELMDRINQLEIENSILKANATQETLAQLPTHPPSTTSTGANSSSTRSGTAAPANSQPP